MHTYRCYGLVIRASLPLPELTPAEGKADVVINEGELPALSDGDFEEDRHFHAVDCEALLAWRGVASFMVRNGREVIFQRLGNLDEIWLRQFLLGPVLGVLLHQRRLLVLHASAIESEAGALALVGWKGQGKSTTAAGLRLRGYELLADDIVAIDMTNPEQPLVIPGIPQLKLWPDAAAALGVHLGDLTPLHPRLEKRALSIPAGSALLPRALRGLYVLDQGKEHQIETLPSLEAFSEIIQHAYAARFIGKAGIPPWHFHQFTALIRANPVHRFRRKPSLEMLPETLDMLEAHFKRDTRVSVLD